MKRGERYKEKKKRKKRGKERRHLVPSRRFEKMLQNKSVQFTVRANPSSMMAL